MNIEGVVEASRLKAMIQGILGGNFLSGIMFELNPKNSTNVLLDQGPFFNVVEMRSGNLPIGMGNRPFRTWAVEEMRNVVVPYRQSHLNGSILNPTIYVNDEPLIKGGHLTILDDHEVLEVARKYGEPDELLGEAGRA